MGNTGNFNYSFYPRWLLEHSFTSGHTITILYFTIVVLSIIVYKLGFAKKLPVLKSAIIYCLLLIGCIILTVLALQLPIVGSLFFAAVVLIIYKLRLKASKKNNQSNKQV